MFNLRNVVTVMKRTVSIPNRKFSLRTGWKQAFGKYLFLTNTGSSGILMLFGDLIEQEIEFQKNILPERYDSSRLNRMFLVGLSQGPLQHYFYLYLQKILPKRNTSSITKKILADQFILSPFSIAAFFFCIGLLERRKINDISCELKDKCLEVYMIDWMVWPPAQFINFYFLPVKYQVLYVNFVTMLYNVFLSYIKHKDQDINTKEIPQTVIQISNNK